MNIHNLEIINNQNDQQFELQLGEDIAKVTYKQQDGKLVLLHTEVPDAFEGQGIGSRLARTSLDFAVENGLAIVPLCPFIAAYIDRHPTFKEHVAEGYEW